MKGSLSTLQDPGHTWQACSSPASFSGLQEGHWLLTLRATDAAGLTRQSRRVLPLSCHAAFKMPASCYCMHACQSRRRVFGTCLCGLCMCHQHQRWSREPACDSPQGARSQVKSCNLPFWLCLKASGSLLVIMMQGHRGVHQQNPSQCHHHWRPQPERQVPVDSDLQLCASDQQQRRGAHCVRAVPAAERHGPAAGDAPFEPQLCENMSSGPSMHRMSMVPARQETLSSGCQPETCMSRSLKARLCAGQVATRRRPERDASSTGNVNVLLQSLDTPASSAPAWANCSSPATYTVSPCPIKDLP